VFSITDTPLPLVAAHTLARSCCMFLSRQQSTKVILSKKKSAGKVPQNDKEPQPLQLLKEEDYEQRLLLCIIMYVIKSFITVKEKRNSLVVLLGSVNF